MDIAVIGAGVVGSAVALELALRGHEVYVLDKNPNASGENQSSRNSGVIHAGVYHDETEPLKARLCVKGNLLLYEFCKQHDIPHRQTGKLVVATNAREQEYLDEVVRVAAMNEVPYELLTRTALEEKEPNVIASRAVFFPTSGIVEPTSLVKKLQRLAKQAGAVFMYGQNVNDADLFGGKFVLTTVDAEGRKDKGSCDAVVNAAGIDAVHVAKMLGSNSYVSFSVRGESAYFLASKAGVSVRHNVYPVPYVFDLSTGEKREMTLEESRRLLKEGEAAKTVGMHLTPTFLHDGTEYVRKGEEFELGDMVTIGPAKSVRVHDLHTGLRDPSYFLTAVSSFFPNLPPDSVQLHQAGLMAMVLEAPDFIIEPDPAERKWINLLGIGSPGLTAALAIARHVREQYFP